MASRKPAAKPDKPRRRWRRWLLFLILAPIILGFVLVLVYRVAAPPLTGVMAERILEARRAGIDGFRIEHRWCPLDDYGPYLPVAVIASED